MDFYFVKFHEIWKKPFFNISWNFAKYEKTRFSTFREISRNMKKLVTRFSTLRGKNQITIVSKPISCHYTINKIDIGGRGIILGRGICGRGIICGRGPITISIWRTVTHIDFTNRKWLMIKISISSNISTICQRAPFWFWFWFRRLPIFCVGCLGYILCNSCL